MPQFVIIHGTVRVGSGTGPDAFKGIGDTVEFSQEEIDAIDPKGECFVTPEKYELIKKQKELQDELAALTDEDKQEVLAEAAKAKKKGKKISVIEEA